MSAGGFSGRLNLVFRAVHTADLTKPAREYSCAEIAEIASVVSDGAVVTSSRLAQMRSANGIESPGVEVVDALARAFATLAENLHPVPPGCALADLREYLSDPGPVFPDDPDAVLPGVRGLPPRASRPESAATSSANPAAAHAPREYTPLLVGAPLDDLDMREVADQLDDPGESVGDPVGGTATPDDVSSHAGFDPLADVPRTLNGIGDDTTPLAFVVAWDYRDAVSARRGAQSSEGTATPASPTPSSSRIPAATQAPTADLPAVGEGRIPLTVLRDPTPPLPTPPLPTPVSLDLASLSVASAAVADGSADAARKPNVESAGDIEAHTIPTAPESPVLRTEPTPLAPTNQVPLSTAGLTVHWPSPGLDTAGERTPIPGPGSTGQHLSTTGLVLPPPALRPRGDRPGLGLTVGTRPSSLVRDADALPRAGGPLDASSTHRASARPRRTRAAARRATRQGLPATISPVVVPPLPDAPPPRPPRPTRGWQALLYTLTGGRINPGTPSALRRQDLAARIQHHLPARNGTFKIVVTSLKGGVGKTTVTACLGLTLAETRFDRVCAVDINPHVGTLHNRLVRGEPYATVQNFLDDLIEDDELDVSHYVGLSGRLAVMAGDPQPKNGSAFTAQEYSMLLEALGRYYNIVLTDGGTGLADPAMEATFDQADALVIVANPTVDAAGHAAKTLELLDSKYQHLVNRCVAVFCCDRTSPWINQEALLRHFVNRCRAVVQIPADNQLAAGSVITLEQLSGQAQSAFEQLADLVVEPATAEPAAAGTALPAGWAAS